MKSLFPQYADVSELDYGKVWKQALFVFDTNVLLNLYRYQSNTRDELLEVLNKLSGSIWIPHHVGLEFQRNRLKVIAEQNSRFNEVRRTIEKAKNSLFSELDKLQLQTRHSLIDPQPLTSGFETLVANYLDKLAELQGTQQKPTATDPLKEKIEAIFASSIGSPPNSQDEIDKLYKHAEERFKFNIPPGFQDAGKGKGDDDASGYIHGGIIYKRKYGDYLIWQQIVAHAKTTQAKSVIFITDDGKDDWWNKIEFDGMKTIGPRPELIEEVRLLASVENFLMYNPEGFLQYSKEFLKAHVSEQTLEEVRQVANRTSNPAVAVSQDVDSDFASPDYNRGIIRITVLRNTQIATGTGKLFPVMSSTPFITARLLEMPDSYPSDMVKFKAGTGTSFDFNINIKSTTYHNPLPLGQYVFSYEAQTTSHIFGGSKNDIPENF